MAGEYAVMGIYPKGHVMEFVRPTLSHDVLPASDIDNLPEGQKVLVAGWPVARQHPRGMEGTVFVTIEDETGDVQLIVRPRVFARYRRELGIVCYWPGVWYPVTTERRTSPYPALGRWRSGPGCPTPTTGIEVTVSSSRWDNREGGQATCAEDTPIIADLGDLAQRFEFDGSDFSYDPGYNIAPTESVLTVRNVEGRAAAFMKWGLIPFWAKDSKIGSRMINARAETVAEKPAFRNALKKRRCLVLADGYYEWQKTPVGKRPFRIVMRRGSRSHLPVFGRRGRTSRAT